MSHGRDAGIGTTTRTPVRSRIRSAREVRRRRKRPVLRTDLRGVAAGLQAQTIAQEFGTRDEARAMVDSAVAHVKKVGPEQAFKDFTQVESKVSYVLGTENFDGFVGVGVYR